MLRGGPPFRGLRPHARNVRSGATVGDAQGAREGDDAPGRVTIAQAAEVACAWRELAMGSDSPLHATCMVARLVSTWEPYLLGFAHLAVGDSYGAVPTSE